MVSQGLVVHSGYVPLVYYKEWFTEKSIEFWKRFLGKLDKDVIFCYENVMEDSPDMLYDIVSEVNDERFGLCLTWGTRRQLFQIPTRGSGLKSMAAGYTICTYITMTERWTIIILWGRRA